MRLKEVCESTGITKRNIHFYIKEGLIDPAVDSQNGYYNFSHDDCRKLVLIRELRKADFPVFVIRSIINNPRTAPYYYRMHIVNIRSQVKYYSDILLSLNELISELPLRPSLDDLCEGMDNGLMPDPPARVLPDSAQPDYDHQLVNHFLWREFLPDDSGLTEYQRYLLDKINILTSDYSSNPDYVKLYKYLSSLDSDTIERLYEVRSDHLSEIAGLSKNDIGQYTESMKHGLEEFLADPLLIKNWKRTYHTYICPDIRIYTSTIGDLAREMSPFLKQYTENINEITSSVYEWLHTEAGSVILIKMESELSGYYDIDHAMHGELEAMHIMTKY